MPPHPRAGEDIRDEQLGSHPFSPTMSGRNVKPDKILRTVRTSVLRKVNPQTAHLDWDQTRPEHCYPQLGFTHGTGRARFHLTDRSAGHTELGPAYSMVPAEAGSVFQQINFQQCHTPIFPALVARQRLPASLGSIVSPRPALAIQGEPLTNATKKQRSST